MLKSGARWCLAAALLIRVEVSTAQEQGSSQDSNQLSEIVVTATKRAERLEDVAGAVSALTGDTLQAMGADSFTDYARSIPGLTFTDAGAGRQTPSIRGLNTPSAVGFYIGETPLPMSVGTVTGTIANPDLVDIDRIEVLRGPQGTLYGLGSMGGTIKLVPNAPDVNKVSGSVQVSGDITQGANGGSPGEKANVVFNLPVIDGVAAVRVALWARDIGGFIDRTYGYTGNFSGEPHPEGTVGNIPDEHTWGFRTTGLVKPTDALSISLMAYVQDQKFDGYQDITGGVTNPNNQLVQNFISNTPEPQENKFALYDLTVTYNFGRFNLVSSTSYDDSLLDAYEEGTSTLQTFLGASVPAFPNTDQEHDEQYSFTEETRLATSEQIFGFDGLVGAFYNRIHTSAFQIWSPPQYNELVADNNPANPLYWPGNDVYGNLSRGSVYQSAIFGELTYHFTDALSVTGGIRRYDLPVGTSDLIQTGLFSGAVPGGSLISNRPSSPYKGRVGVVPKADISYKISPDSMVYALFSEGFRRGGPGSAVPSQCDQYTGGPVGPDLQPDSVKNYEVGAKTTWLDKRLTVNTALYRINWSRIQQTFPLPCGFYYSGNFGEAILKGVELELDAHPTNRISAGVSGSYISAKLQDSDTFTGAVAGNQIENVPNWNFALYAESTYPVFQGADGFTRLDYQYTGTSYGAYGTLANGSRDPATELGALRLLNLKSGIRLQGWEFSAAGTNLLNEIARQSIENSLEIPIPGRPRYVVNRPRTFWIKTTYSF